MKGAAMDKHTVIITGASSGIGYALASAFLERGWNVVGNARDHDRLQSAGVRLGHAPRFLAVAGDIALPETAQRLFAEAATRFGRVDLLVNNAGLFLPKPVADYTPDDIDLMVATNLKGFVYPTQQAALHMRAHGGQIVNITAGIALQPNAGVPALLPVLIKGGINSATRALALELAAHNIRVNAVAPGIIDTPMHAPDSHAFLGSLAPLARIGSTQDVVDAVFYLAGAGFTTGAVLAVDGGMSAGKW
jgi:NAD(P)-dependent dehydrogenase (short-subunit alcohol dehydrogenase family)